MRAPFSTEAGRLEAFSDGVIAVIITIMVLDLRPPQGSDFGSLRAVVPTLATYVLSFIFVGIYWNNHHHMLRAARAIDGRAMWANLHLLFWLSLAPFTTAWLGANLTAAVPTAVYGFGLLMDAIAYTLLQNALLAVNGREGPFGRAIKSDRKGRISLFVYLVAIGIAFVAPFLSDALYVTVAVIWFVPDPRLEPVIAALERVDTGERGS
jgi:uncharacterized membrane protein